MLKGNSNCSFYIIFFLFFELFGLNQSANAQDIKEEDIKKMKDAAEKVMRSYLLSLNSIGRADAISITTQYDDIAITIQNYFENSSVLVYNDIMRVRSAEAEYLNIKEYMEKIIPNYQKGVTFQYNWNIKNPCLIREPNSSYFLLRVVTQKRLQGEYYQDNAVHENNDSLDVFIKFPIKQTRPVLVTDLPRISEIKKYDGARPDCPPEETKIDDIVISDFEQLILRRRAEDFVRDYNTTLNVIGNPILNDRYETTDYFESKSTPVYNDIFPIILKDEFIADDYLRYIEIWYQEGISFDYTAIRANNVLTFKDFVSVEIEVDRTIRVPSRNFRDRQTISIFVKFPIDPKAKKSDLYPNNNSPSVGIERSTPRIYKIEKKRIKINAKNYLAVGFQVNTANYFGDLNPFDRFLSTEIKFTQPSFAIHATKKITPHLFIRSSFSLAWLKGDDYTSANPNDNIAKYRYIRNAHFRNRIAEFALLGVYELRPNKGLYFRRRFFSPYVFAGIALFHHNPQARTPSDLGTQWVDLQPLGTEGQGQPGFRKKYSRIQPAIPFGFGAKFKVTNRIDLGWEMGIRFTFTDFLDDVSGNYADPGDLSSDLSRVMANRTLEPFGQLTGGSRTTQINRLLGEFGGGQPFEFIGSDGQLYKTFNGYGRAGDQRGSASTKDYYVFTGFRINYLLKVGQPPSGKSKSKFRIDL
jgi:hypothetical protein